MSYHQTIPEREPWRLDLRWSGPSLVINDDARRVIEVRARSPHPTDIQYARRVAMGLHAQLAGHNPGELRAYSRSSRWRFLFRK